MLTDTAEILNGELARNETLLWSGQPRQGLFLKPGDVSSIVFSLVWLGGAIYWEAVNFDTHADTSSKLFGIFLILVGLFFVVGRFFVDARERRQIYYGLTEQRIILMQQKSTMSVRSIPLATLCEVTVITDIAGFGTVTFGLIDINNHHRTNSATWPIMGGVLPIKLDTVADARNVSETIRSAQYDAHNAACHKAWEASAMPHETHTILEEELTPSETLLWSGQPRQGIFFKTGDAYSIPFSLLWSAAAITMTVVVFSQNAPWSTKLVMLFVAYMALHVIAGRFIVDAQIRAHTYYGVTNERILVVNAMKHKCVRSLALWNLGKVEVLEYTNGFGSLSFGLPIAPVYLMQEERSWIKPLSSTGFRTGVSFPPIFDTIPDAVEAYVAIRSAQKKAS